MATEVLMIAMVALVSLTGFHCSHFDPTLQDNATKYACTGSTVILPWTVTVEEQEQIVDIQWLFNGQSEEMVAMFAHGNFLPMPSYSHRARYLPTSGIALSHVTDADKGDYSVQITGRDSSGGFFSLTRTAHLVVTDGILSSERLVVRQEPTAVYNEESKEWSVQLTCGTFIFPGHSAPFDVQWTDPEGRVFSSSTYTDGTFHLLLSNPVPEGNFTCHLPKQVDNCSPAGKEGQAAVAASVMVNGAVARTTVLEARLGDVVKENQRFRDNVTRIMQENEMLKETVTGLQRQQASLLHQTASFGQQLQQLQAHTNTSALSQLVQRVHILEAASQRQDTDRALQLHHLHELMDSLNHTSAQCCHDLAQLTQQTHSLTQQYAKLSADLTSLRHGVNGNTSSLSSTVSSLSQRVSQTDQKCSALDTQVDRLGAQVSSASGANSALSKLVSSLQGQVSTGSQQTTSLSQQLSEVKSQVREAGQTASSLQHDLHSALTQLTHLNSRSALSDVSFHVTMASGDKAQPGHGQALVLSDVISNRGNAYSATSGRFTAPASATYLFVASISAWTKGHYAEAYLMSGQREVGYVETYTDSHYQSGTTHAVLHLSTGHTVWLRNNGDSYYNHEATAFSGALLHLDP